MNVARPASLGIFIIGLAATFAWAWWQLGLFNQIEPGPKCGLPILGILGGAIVGAGITSLIAVLLNFLAFRRLPRPLPLSRVFELVALAIPAAIAVVLVGILLYAG